MKKIFMLVLSVCALLFVYNQKPIPVATSSQIINPDPKEIIRFHVVANSDTPADQAIKRKVRDAVVEAMSPVFGQATSLKEAKQLASENLPEIETIANNTIQGLGYSHKATAKLGVFPFPTKTYGNFSLPAGDYHAVKIEIGKGKGQNWWCVLFPPLCFVDLTHGLAANPAMVPIKQPQMNQQEMDNYQELNVEQGKVEIRFALLEWLDTIF